MTGLRLVAGGLDGHPLAAKTVRPRWRNRGLVADPVSHVGNVRTRPAPRDPVPLYDHEQDPDRPTIPRRARFALDVVAHHVRVPHGAVTRQQALDALDVIAAWVDPTKGGAA